MGYTYPKELEKAKRRIHILEGLIHMVDDLEEVIKLIRASKGKADAKNKIMEAFGFTELQAEAIVTLQLYRLSSTDVNALIAENSELHEKVRRLEIILSNEKELLKVNKELTATTLKLKEIINKLAETDMQQMSGLTTEKVYVEMLRQYTDLLKITVELKKRIDLLEAK